MSLTAGFAPVVFLTAVFLILQVPAMAADESRPCVAEPTEMTIAYGDAINGPFCVIGTPADIDRFYFSGSVGDIIVANLTDNSGTADVCIDLFSPTNVHVAGPSCAAVPNGVHGFGPVTLTETGTYAFVVFDGGFNQTAGYSFTLERIKPPSATSTPLTPSQMVTSDLNPSSDFDLYHFNATAGDVLRLLFTRNGGTAVMSIIDPDGLTMLNAVGGGTYDINATKTGVHVALIWSSNTLAISGYSLISQCLLGPCAGPAPPDCVSELNVFHSAGTLNLGFILGNRMTGATWDAWITLGSSTIKILSVPLPASPIQPPIPIDIPVSNFPSVGKIGILTAVTTGLSIGCSDWEVVNTGTPAPGARVPSAEDLAGRIWPSVRLR